MNRQAHLVIGIVLFLFSRTKQVSFTTPPIPIVFGIIAAAAGSSSRHPTTPSSAVHRGLFHGRRMLKTVAVLLVTASAVLFAPGTPRLPLAFSTFNISGFFPGYAAHPVADSLTRAGLPG